MENRLITLVESRIHREVYVRFGGEFLKTCYSNIVRRRVLILHIQHPQRVRQRMEERSADVEQKAVPVHKRTAIAGISLLEPSTHEDGETPGFYGLEKQAFDSVQDKATEAVVHGTQTLVNGSVVKLRLREDLLINGSCLPAGSFVFGTASLEGERLEIGIHSIRNGSSLFAVKMKVYDLDGLPGIFIPSTITSEVSRQSADNSLSMLGLSSMNPSLKAQATAAGVQTVKNLFSKKIKPVKVTVQSGYRLLLQDLSTQ